MKQRSPVYVTIAIILVILFIMYYMFVQNSSFLSSPYFWGTAVISTILALIQNAIGDLIENEKFKKLWDVGFRYFCNVDSTQYWLQYGSNYMRQGRRNMDGQMMFKQMVYPEKVLTSDLFDVYDVFDRRRPLPVNGITVPEDFDLQALADSLGMSDRITN